MLRKKSDEDLKYEFMPSALEIIERPPSPTGSYLLRAIVVFVIVVILWSIIGKVDEVAIARGKIVPDGRSKVIQPMEEGSLTAIHIEEGQKVKKGELLIELDSTLKKADLTGVEKSLQTAKLEKELIKNEISGEDISYEAILQKVQTDKLDKMEIESIKKSREAKNMTYKEEKASMLLIIEQKKGELKIAKADLERVRKLYNSTKKEEESLKRLLNSGTIPRNEWLKVKNQTEQIEQDISSGESKVNNASEKIKEVETNYASMNKNYEAQILSEMVELDKQIIGIETELTKAKKKFELQKLYSPIDGTINGLALNTIGGVVSSGQNLVTIVPDNTPLIVEVMIQNSDIGFININQSAEIKLDTFPFQRYGSIQGKVVNISPDAYGEEKDGLKYKVRIKPERDYVVIKNKKIMLSSGMALTSEIKTGKRRIIDFFLSPLYKFSQESFKLR